MVLEPPMIAFADIHANLLLPFLLVKMTEIGTPSTKTSSTIALENCMDKTTMTMDHLFCHSLFCGTVIGCC